MYWVKTIFIYEILSSIIRLQMSFFASKTPILGVRIWDSHSSPSQSLWSILRQVKASCSIQTRSILMQKSPTSLLRHLNKNPEFFCNQTISFSFFVQTFGQKWLVVLPANYFPLKIQSIWDIVLKTSVRWTKTEHFTCVHVIMNRLQDVYLNKRWVFYFYFFISFLYLYDKNCNRHSPTFTVTVPIVLPGSLKIAFQVSQATNCWCLYAQCRLLSLEELWCRQ